MDSERVKNRKNKILEQDEKEGGEIRQDTKYIKKVTGMTVTEWKELDIDGGKTKFRVPSYLEIHKKVGSGAYGCVVAFKDNNSKRNVAVKKITNAYADVIDGKRILREIKLLRGFDHENVIRILDMYPPEQPDHDDIYIVTDLMETDLHRVIYSKQPLSDEHAQYFIYQILRGLLYLHSANVVHRDLKPSNILVNKNCDLKICDFGLSRSMSRGEDDPAMTDYVVTRWYRAPEVVLLASEYTEKIDVWSVACILCETIGRKPLFTGKDHLDQIRKIIDLRGTPKETDLTWLPPSGPARKFLGKCEQSSGTDLRVLYPKASSCCIEFIDMMLRFDPAKRADVQTCLEHEYLKELHYADDEPKADFVIDWEFDNFQPTRKILQEKVYEECARFHPWIIERDREKIMSYFKEVGTELIDRIMKESVQPVVAN